jgi:hypothetical protein
MLAILPTIISLKCEDDVSECDKIMAEEKAKLDKCASDLKKPCDALID